GRPVARPDRAGSRHGLERLVLRGHRGAAGAGAAQALRVVAVVPRAEGKAGDGRATAAASEMTADGLLARAAAAMPIAVCFSHEAQDRSRAERRRRVYGICAY